MEENRITAITKEKTDVLTEAYQYTLEILDAYDHQTLTRPEGTYYDGNETIEEVAVNMLYDMIKNPVWYDCDKQMAAIKFLLFLEWNNALFVDGEKRISDSIMIEDNTHTDDFKRKTHCANVGIRQKLSVRILEFC